MDLSKTVFYTVFPKGSDEPMVHGKNPLHLYLKYELADEFRKERGAPDLFEVRQIAVTLLDDY